MIVPALGLVVAGVLSASLPRATPEAAAQVQNTADARQLLQGKGEPHAALRVTYEGTYALEAHLSKPHDTMLFGARLRVLSDGGERARLDWESWQQGHEDQRDLDTTLLVGARAWRRLDKDKPFAESSGKAAALLRARVEALIPWRTLARVRGAPEHCSDVGATALSWTDAAEFGGFVRRFAWNGASKQLESITRVFAHPRLGDARDECRYGAWEERDGLALPSTITLREVDGANVLRASPAAFELKLSALETPVELAHELDAPSDATAEIAPTPTSPGRIGVEEIQPGLCSFASPELDGRTVVVEFDDHLVAIDAPLSSELGERIVEAIATRFPKKPVRYVLFGHFHPHYTGGLRAFLAAGATVVAPAGCAAFANEIAQRAFTLAPDAWARAGRKAAIESFSGSRVFEDAHQRLEVLDIGAKSGHTDEYVVFYLPHGRTLLQDDVGWSATSDGTLRMGRGARGLYELVREKKLDVETLWQSWPLTNPRPSIRFAELERGLNAKR